MIRYKKQAEHAYNMLGRFYIFQNFTNTTYAQVLVLQVLQVLQVLRVLRVLRVLQVLQVLQVLVQELVPVLLPLSWQAQPLSFLAPMGSRPT
jgi:hypothetical protein